MKKPQVLFILHLPPPMYGAAVMGNYIKQSKLINNEFEADYINLATNKVLSESGKGSLKKLVTFTKLLRNLFSILRSKKYDLCYVTLTACGAGFYKDLVVISVIRMFNKKIVYHFHNKGVSNPKNKITHSLYQYVFKNTKSILLSKYLYPDVEQYVQEKDVYYCPCGVPPTEVNFERSVKWATANGEAPCKLLYLSNMMREKGIFVLLDACKILKEKGIRFECHFVGGWLDVTEEAFAQKVKEMNLSDVVFAHGPKYNEDKQAFFRNADIFVFPTFYHYETFGLVNLEAMQYQLPIVSTPEGGIPDVVIQNETGYLVPQHNATALAEKINCLIENPALRQKMGKEGKARFYELFTLQKFEMNMTNVLHKAVVWYS